jgi:hypothetical protein
MFDVFYFDTKPDLNFKSTYAKTINEAQSLAKTEHFWFLSGHNNYSEFDFNFIPAPWEQHHTFIWPSSWQESGRVMLVRTDAVGPDHYMDNCVRSLATVDVFFIDTHNKKSEASLESIKTDGNLIKMRSTGDTVAAITRACNRATTDFIWVVSSAYDYSKFDFSWHPATWQANNLHVFSSNKQQWANVFYVNVSEFLRLAQWYTEIHNFPSLNFVNDVTVSLFDNNHEVWYVDFGNNKELESTVDYNITRFNNSYLETIKRVCNKTSAEYIWVTSSTCDYSGFEFDWEPEPWQKNMIHVFRSNEQPFGDTFFVPVQEFLRQSSNIELLEWFKDVNYVDYSVPRHPFPVVHYTGSLTDAINNAPLTGIYTDFVHSDATIEGTLPSPVLWRKEDRVLLSVNSGIVARIPRDAAQHINTQVYDFSNIASVQSSSITVPPLDVIFISNGEECAERNYDALCRVCSRAKRSDGVNGRLAAYQAAARLSTTEWFFAVFAKCKVNPEFDFSWQPDRLQANKHYIFNAHNPINGLTYGHMAIIAYHRDTLLSLTDSDWYSDVTLSSLHETVQLLSCEADYAESPYAVWKTAFREALKLAADTDVESQYRLNQWLTVGNGEYGKYSIMGAEDAVAYYCANSDNLDALQAPAEWKWCEAYWKNKGL